MKIFKPALLIITVLASELTFAQQANRDFDRKTDSIFARWNNLHTPGLSVAILKDNKIIYSKGYGIANMEYGIPNETNTVFDIASLTKQFTAFSIALLVQSGRISLDDDIRKFIPELHDFGKPIKIRHLLSHSSGLRDQNELLYLSGWKQEDIITNDNILNLIFRQRELNFSPGEQFKYCNSGYTLLALLTERVTGVPFSEWANENIFKPLKMKNSFFITNNNQVIRNRAYSYSNGETGYEMNLLNSSTIGARGLQSTVEDLSLWVSNFTKHTVGNNYVFGEMNTVPENVQVKYNYGQAFNKYKNLNLIEHDGSDAGYRSYIGRFPDQKFAIILLGNLSSINPKNLAMQIADIYLFNQNVSSVIQANDKEKIEVPAMVEKGMEGQFQIAADKILTVWVDDHAFKATISNEEKLYYLKPFSSTEFEIKELNVKISFQKGSRQTDDSIIYKTDHTRSVLPKIFAEDEESKKLSEYVGEYYSDELSVSYKMTKRNNMLIVELPRDFFVSMKKQDGDNFTGSYYWFRRVKFSRDESMKVMGFELSTGRSYNIKFIKKN